MPEPAMGKHRPDTGGIKESAAVVLSGRLKDRPELVDLPMGGNLCEIEIQVKDETIPVRFTGKRAEQIAGYEKDCFVRLRGELRRFEWKTTDHSRRERLVVNCREITLVRGERKNGKRIEDLA